MSEVGRSLPSAALPKRTMEVRWFEKASLAESTNSSRTFCTSGGRSGTATGLTGAMNGPRKNKALPAMHTLGGQRRKVKAKPFPASICEYYQRPLKRLRCFFRGNRVSIAIGALQADYKCGAPNSRLKSATSEAAASNIQKVSQIGC